MNNEKYNQIIDEVYKNFIDKTKGLNLNLEINKDIIVVEGPIYHATPRLLSQEEFINKIKTNPEFSEKWELKIEERELSDDELNIFNLFKQNPTKLITLTYNNEKIESYE